MHISRHVLQQEPLPPYLLAAAIDYINFTRPKLDGMQHALSTFALRLGYDATIAAILSIRVSATARMFADPLWPSVRRLARNIDSTDTPLFDIVVQRFISTEPLDATLAFDTRRLLTALLSALPHKGRA